MPVPTSELKYKYAKGDNFVLTITDRMARQSSLEDEEPVYHTNLGISIPESNIEKLLPVQNSGKLNNVDNYLMLVIDKTSIDKVRKQFFSTWAQAYVAMTQELVSSYTSSDLAEESFKNGEAIISNYSAVNNNLDIRIVQVF